MSGMVLKMHFCGANLSSWTLSKQKANCCCESGTSEKEKKSAQDDCCNDKSIALKISDIQQHASKIQLQLDFLQVALVNQSFPVLHPVQKLQDAPGFSFRANAPPDGLWQNIPLFILHQQFTYYG